MLGKEPGMQAPTLEKAERMSRSMFARRKPHTMLIVAFSLLAGFAPALLRPTSNSMAGFGRASGSGQIVHGDPSNYLALLRQLHPGETLLLEPGAYRPTENGSGLPIYDMHGSPDAPIVITGPESGPRPILYASNNRNTVRIANASYITIRDLDLDGRNLDVDGVKAEGVSDHITVENLCIQHHGNNQQTVGISTKAPAWDWVVRRNTILGAGTGIYLGDSDGSKPFVHGTIEYNLIRDTVGYNMEIKHQIPRPDLPGMPTAPGATIIRHNVFSKAQNGSVDGMARPNLLVGHFPLSGVGAEDVYEIYGNFFYENPTGEVLFQGEGNVAIYNNVFWNDQGDAVLIRPQNAYPRKVSVFWNTVLADGTGIKVVGGWDAYRQRVIGNLVFAPIPILASDVLANVTGPRALARSYLRHPEGPLGQLDLSTLPEKLTSRNLPRQLFSGYDDAFLDFEGAKRGNTPAGAYEASHAGPHWLPSLEIKPVPTTAVIGDSSCLAH